MRRSSRSRQWTRELDLPLTVNAVMHRQNLHQLSDIIQMAVDLDADRLEVANVQYYGWALKNRAALDADAGSRSRRPAASSRKPKCG